MSLPRRLFFPVWPSKARQTHHGRGANKCVLRANLVRRKSDSVRIFISWPHDLSPVVALSLPEEDKVAPDEDTDMDLVADRLVLLSLPVKAAILPLMDKPVLFP